MRAEALLPELEEARRAVAQQLGVQRPARFDVYLAPDEQAFRSLLGDAFPHWGVGAAFPGRRTVVLMPFRGDHTQTLRTARHEVAHILLHDALRNSGQRVPTWFDEGVAMWAAGEWRTRDRLDVFLTVLSDGLVALDDLDRVLAFPQARADLGYTQSQMAVLFILELGGPDAVAKVVENLRAGRSFAAALQQVTGLSLEAFETELAGYVNRRYGPAALATSAPALWIYASLLLLASFVGVRYRNRARLKEWDREDPAAALPSHLRPRLRVVSGRAEAQGSKGEKSD